MERGPRLAVVPTVVMAVAPLLAACAGGFEPPTDQVYIPGVGVNERRGSVDVLNALIVSGSEGSGTVVAGLVNNDQDDADALTSVTGAGDDTAIEVTINGGPLEIPPDGSYQTATQGEVSVEGPRVEVGRFLELRFSFERAESVTVEVPVVAREGEFAHIPVPPVSPTATP